MKRRVVISGLGCVTSLGADVDKVWGRILKGESGIGRTTLFDTSHFPTKISGEVHDWSLADVGEEPDQWTHQARHTRFAVGAAKMAAADALLTESSVVPTRMGVYLGCGDAYQDFAQFMEMVSRALDGEQLNLSEYMKAGLSILDPAAELEMEPHMPTSHVARIFNAQGPTCSCFTACAASGQAIGEAAEAVRRGDADIMLAGGAHSLIHPFGFTGLSLLTALSTHNDEPTKASRPFDRDRDGFVLGEGAGILVLEELDHARARGAPIYAEIRGYGSSADAYRITDAHPEGRGAARCMKIALDDARLNP